MASKRSRVRVYAHTAPFIDRVKIVASVSRERSLSLSLYERVDTLDASSYIAESNYTVSDRHVVIRVSLWCPHGQPSSRFLFLVFLTGYHGCWNYGLSSWGVRLCSRLFTVIICLTTVSDWSKLVFGDVRQKLLRGSRMVFFFFYVFLTTRTETLRTFDVCLSIFVT